MPEGDTVWRTARDLHDALAGRPLTRSDVRVPQWATLDLRGVTVDDAVSRGKHLFVRAGDVSLHTHLKMEGVWHVYPPNGRWRRPAHTARVVLENTDHQAVGFSLGLVEVLDRVAEADAMAWLGPDLLSRDWSLDEAVRRVTADPDRPVFLALHDQRNLAGFGNEYVTELCFLHGLLPTRPVGEITDVAHVIERGQRLIEANCERAARTFTGNTRARETHWVFDRDRRPCRRCGTTVQRGVLGDDPVRQRNTYWCPHCQT
ncbi:DNA-formamidopyrimidine glycosylase family protein [Aeromicrobium sp.]|uniref:DNA-formamidopyrimidine glycosylase family protein n=1 Tax=Aeromicrobium sp. TaxID=1871063 RepID=UPI003D6BFC3E